MINYSKNNQKGSVMIEALAMLGLIAMVTPMLYRKAAERTTELQDINIASQIRMVSAAVDSYLKDNYSQLASRGNTFLIKNGDDATADEQADYNGVSAYLPEGFDLEHASKLFEGFEIAVRKDTATDLEGNTRNVFTSAVVANLKDDMTKMRAAKIASMIGTNGGMVSTGVDGGGDTTYSLNGTQGTWSATPNLFGFGDTPGWRDNSLVSISSEAISSSSGDVGSDEALFRVWKGEAGFNTMETSLLFGGDTATVALDMQGHDIRNVNNLTVNGTTALGGNVITDINLAGNLAFRGDGRSIQNVRTIVGSNNNLSLQASDQIEMDTNLVTVSGEMQVGGAISSNSLTSSGNITSTNGNISASNGTVSGRKLEAGTEGINTQGDITMNNNDITGIDEASGNIARFTNIIGGTITASSITVTGDNGISMGGKPINMGGGNINGVGNITMNSANSTLNMNGGDITNVGSIEGDNAEFDDITAGTVAASAITGSVGTFDDLHAKNYLTVGGNVHNQGTVLEVTTDSDGTALFKTNQFGVGPQGATNYNSAGNKIVIDNNTAFIGSNYDNNTLGITGLKASSGHLGIYQSNAGTSNSSIEMSSNMITLSNSAGVGVTADTEGFLFTDVSVAGGAKDLAGLGQQPKSDEDGVLTTNQGDGLFALISRRGVLELAPPDGEGNESGYIRARRLVSDIPYTPDQWGGDGWGDADYPYYEVNPAYTSVMNDIKLASRGGARLSDILPDYINKGIYIADNTYGEGFDWADSNGVGKPNQEVQGEADANECSDCATSPWLGFVPAPMCPPGYVQVVTLEPMRWKMAEVYTFANSNYNESGNDLKVNGFDNVYYHPTGSDWPSDERDKKAPYVTVEVTEAGNGTHTATAELHGAHPVVLQTNTWLSTTIVESDSGDKKGWHTVMGFIYPKDEYAGMYQRLNGSAPAADMWNMFPVYPQEMAAVARVYCSFMRYDNGWTWGEGSSPVFQYDQLDHYKESKDSDWIAQVSDPNLGRQTEW